MSNCKAPGGNGCVNSLVCNMEGHCMYDEEQPKLGHIDPVCEDCKGLLTDIIIDDQEEVYCKACDLKPADQKPEDNGGLPWDLCKGCQKYWLAPWFPGFYCVECILSQAASIKQGDGFFLDGSE
jgi:hypothetical protein